MSDPTIWDIAMGGNPPEKFVPYADYTRLKAEVARLRSLDSLKTVSLTDSTNWQAIGAYAEAKAETARLQAEVERLTFDPLTYLDDQGEWMPRHTHLAAVARLQAQVDRLTKAGDAIYQSFDGFGQVDATTLKAWHAAKEGQL